ncbi:MAG: Hsp20/alpha crystallin family protein [Desulfonatronovibrio sp.]
MLEKWLPSQRSGNVSRNTSRRNAPENMLDLFEEMWTRPFRGFGEFPKEFTPSVEISEKEDSVQVRAEVAGLNPEDIDVSVENNNLILRGEKKREQKDEQENYVHMECSYGSFNRVIPLRADIDKDNVSASYKNGVLSITLPKTKESRSKKISIES